MSEHRRKYYHDAEEGKKQKQNKFSNFTRDNSQSIDNVSLRSGAGGLGEGDRLQSPIGISRVQRSPANACNPLAQDLSIKFSS